MIEAVDVPDDPLHENLVLVKSDQRTKRFRRELLEQDAVGWLVAGEDFVGDQFVLGGAGDSLFSQFGSHFGFGFAAHKGFGLGEEIG